MWRNAFHQTILQEKPILLDLDPPFPLSLPARRHLGQAYRRNPWPGPLGHHQPRPVGHLCQPLHLSQECPTTARVPPWLLIRLKCIPGQHAPCAGRLRPATPAS